MFMVLSLILNLLQKFSVTKKVPENLGVNFLTIRCSLTTESPTEIYTGVALLCCFLIILAREA